MSFEAREVTRDELDALPAGSIVFRMRPTSFRDAPEPMQKWPETARHEKGTWSVLGEYDEDQQVEHLARPGGSVRADVAGRHRRRRLGRLPQARRAVVATG